MAMGKAKRPKLTRNRIVMMVGDGGELNQGTVRTKDTDTGPGREKRTSFLQENPVETIFYTAYISYFGSPLQRR
jgi:hypothetical protein